MTCSLPCCAKLLQFPYCLFAWCFTFGGIQLAELLDNVFLDFEVCLLCLAYIRCALLFVCEEGIASIAEPLPYLVAVFTRHRSDCFPFFLELDECIGCFAPFSALLQLFSFFAKFDFLCEVSAHVLFGTFEIICLAAEEVIAKGAESCKKGVVGFF